MKSPGCSCDRGKFQRSIGLTRVRDGLASGLSDKKGFIASNGKLIVTAPVNGAATSFVLRGSVAATPGPAWTLGGI